MAKQNRAKRVLILKQTIMIVVLAMTVLPAISAVLLLDKVNRLETRYEYLVEQNENIRMDSAAAFADNPNATVSDVAVPVSLEATEAGQQATEEQEDHRVYLTFDDGPSGNTDEILDILAANNVKATFFVIGRDESYYDIYRRIVEEGHTLAMHSYSHEYKKIYSSVEAFRKDLVKLQDVLYDATGIRCSIYRFPGGSSNSIVKDIHPYIDCLKDMGITYYDWNALNGDAVSKELSCDKLISNIMKNVRQNKNSVVLMHDLMTRHTTVESLQELIDTLKQEGYELLPIDENTPLVQHIKADE